MALLTKGTLSTCLISLLSLGAAAQLQLVEIDKPQLSQSVAGTVIDPSGAAIPEVPVEEFSANWKKFIRATHTDRNGKFYFTPQQGRTLYHLQFRNPGFNTVRLKIKLDSKAKPRITVKMSIAT